MPKLVPKVSSFFIPKFSPFWIPFLSPFPVPFLPPFPIHFYPRFQYTFNELTVKQYLMFHASLTWWWQANSEWLLLSRFIPISNTLSIPVSNTLSTPISNTLFIPQGLFPIHFSSQFLFPLFPGQFLPPPPMQSCTHVLCPVPNVRIGHHSN